MVVTEGHVAKTRARRRQGFYPASRRVAFDRQLGSDGRRRRGNTRFPPSPPFGSVTALQERHTMPAKRRPAAMASALQAVTLVFLVLPTVTLAEPATSDDLAVSRRWVADHFAGGPPAGQLMPPFSFDFDGKPSSQLLGEWDFDYATQPMDDQRTRHLLTWTANQTGLVVRCAAIEYHQFPVVEWTLYFRNTGRVDTPIIENIQALDTSWSADSDGDFILHHAVGSPANGADYGPLETPLGSQTVKRISAAGGRPTNSDLSYFNLQWGDQGVIIAVGWPGQWAAEFARDDRKGVRVKAGQELTHFKLLPGEEVRTPLMVLLFWQGDWIQSQNVWRRWMMAHSMPKPGGKLPQPQFVASSSRAYEEMIGANEANQIMHIDRYLEEGLKLDYWWMDAGWYVQQHGWPQVGTWEIDPRRFPNGFRPISEHAHAKGVKTLVWFEPERVMPGTWLYENRPQWLLRATSASDHPLAGMQFWASSDLNGTDPCVTYNPTSKVHKIANIQWDPGRLSFHPGPQGEFSVVRYIMPEKGVYDVMARFLAIDQQTTTDVHVLHNGRSVFDSPLNLNGHGRQVSFQDRLTLSKGDTLDCVVGWGNGTHICDSTGLEFQVVDTAGKVADAAKAFHAEPLNPSPWSYGYLSPGDSPDASTFRNYDRPGRPNEEGVRLLNLGDPEARTWLTEHIDKLLTEQGIDLYRQDFNMDPLAFWRTNDAADRQGITEIRHVTGYLDYWDELRRRHPDMLIDTCASGGRRNDLETLRRAVPLWRSDYAFEPVGHQCMTYGISLWIPYHGTGTVACANATYYGGGVTPVEPYAFWSNAAPSLGSGIDIRIKEIDYDAFRRLVGQWRRINKYYVGDFYPLTPYSRANDTWMAWQFDCPESGEGMIQVFRRTESSEGSRPLQLQGLEPQAHYEITNLDLPEEKALLTGADLADKGLTVTLAQQPAAAVFNYRRVDSRN